MNHQIPIYILSLKGDDERLNPLVTKLQSLNLSYEVCYGISSENIPLETLRSLRSKIAWFRMGRFITKEEYACAQSHKWILEKFLQEEKGSHALILEDDALVTDEIKSLLDPSFWKDEDMVILGSVFQKPDNLIKSRSMPNGNFLLEGYVPTGGAFARIVSKKFAKERLLEWSPRVFPHDTLMFSRKNYTSYILSRDIVFHPPKTISQSRITLKTIHSVHSWFGKGNKLWKRIVWVFWRIVNRILIAIEELPRGSTFLHRLCNYI